MNGMEKRNFTNSARNGGKTAEMRNNSAKSGMVGMSATTYRVVTLQSLSNSLTFQVNIYGVSNIDPSNSSDTKRNACYSSLQYSYIQL